MQFIHGNAERNSCRVREADLGAGAGGELLAVTDLETLKQLEKDAWAKQDARAVPLSLRRIWSEGGTLYGEPRHNGLVGMEESVDSLQSAVEQAIKVQTE